MSSSFYSRSPKQLCCSGTAERWWRGQGAPGLRHPTVMPRGWCCSPPGVWGPQGAALGEAVWPRYRPVGPGTPWAGWGVCRAGGVCLHPPSQPHSPLTWGAAPHLGVTAIHPFVSLLCNTKGSRSSGATALQDTACPGTLGDHPLPQGWQGGQRGQQCLPGCWQGLSWGAGHPKHVPPCSPGLRLRLPPGLLALLGIGEKLPP